MSGHYAATPNVSAQFQGQTRIKLLLPIMAIALLFFAPPARAQVVLTFDDVPAGLLSTQYQNKGATFNFPLNRDSAPGLAHSGTKAIELCFATEFCKSPLKVTFTTPQRRVKVFVGVTSQIDPALPVLMQAFNSSGAIVAQKTVMLGPSSVPVPVQVPLEVISASANITQVVAGFDGPNTFNNGLVFDDFQFDTAGPPPVCTATAAPQVTLLQPNGTVTTQLNDFLLQGSVSTQAPLDSATLTVQGPGGQKVSSILGPIIQTTSAPFGAIHVNDSLFEGTNTVTVTARNCRGTGGVRGTVIYTPVAEGTKVNLLGMEITQATQDVNNSVPLIAGKPTGVRLYFSTTGGLPAISNVRADISGFREGGNTPFLAQSVGTATIDSSTDLNAKRRDSTRSVNFILSPDFSQQGVTRFRVERLFVDGVGSQKLVCVGCTEWRARFNPVRPLNLVVVPFIYSLGNRTADTGASLLNGLGYLNNVFPISGNFPTDTSGINLTLLPLRTTGLELPRDNDRMLFNLQNILDDLLSQPGNTLPADTRILGVGPSGHGGVAYRPGTVAYGDIRATEDPAEASDPENYGAVWAQELAHSFGRMHVSTSHGEMPPTDPDFPYAHGGIGEPGFAIGTEGWNGTPFVVSPGNPGNGAKHAHDFMSYGAPNDRADHTFSWTSPYTYNGLMKTFQIEAAPGLLQSAEDKIAIRGNIKSGVATLGPFHITRTAYAKSSGASGDLSVDLLNAAGQTLLRYRFNAQSISDLPVAAFSEFVPWKAGTKQIVLKRNQTVLATRAVSANKPTLRIVGPRAGESWSSNGAILWQAADADNDALTFTVFYNNGNDQRWIPIATDITKQSISIDTRMLVGSTKARVRVRATDGVNTTEAESALFTVKEQEPIVTILRLRNNDVISSLQNAEFTGAAYDPREGMLPSDRLRWTSNRDGVLGTGRHLKTSRPLSRGEHTITLTATNSQGKVGTRKVKILVR